MSTRPREAVTASAADPSTWVVRAARLGLAARGLTYLLLAWLCGEIAIGHPHHQASDSGAFELFASHTWGSVLLLVVALGFGGYALWSLTVVAGTLSRAHGPRTVSPKAGFGYVKEGARFLAALLRAGVYGFLCYLASGLAIGAGHSSSGDPAPLAARVMREPAGQLIVAAAGAAVITGGAVLVWRSLRRRFLDDLDTREMTAEMRHVVGTLGAAGSLARGVVVSLVGFFLLVSGMTGRPGRSKGLDASLLVLDHQPYGPVLLAGVAVGLGVFGAFSALEARYIQT